ERGRLLLQMGNLATVVGYHPQAESWYRQLSAIAPGSYVLLVNSLSAQKKFSEAVDLCLGVAPHRPSGEVATVLSQVLATAGNPADLEARVGPTITAAVEANRDNLELLMSAAVRAVMADHNDEAIRLFRKVLERQPNHTMALNNLATLLAERPNQLTEAQECAERAVATGGRWPASLDADGTDPDPRGETEH